MIAQDKAVAIQYSVKDDTGTQVDSSEGRGPLWYLHGHNNIIPGLEKALEGLQEGDAFDADVPAEEAYGEHREELVQRVPMEAFQGVEKVEVGMVFNAQTDGGPLQVAVTEVDEDAVVVDGNHPLAGKALAFSGKVETVREASSEELEHGHVHDGDAAN
ncbi:MAG: peptidylprolyl isomerase [Natronospirillum sp.]|uniref:FKBP-type peptidyl-prolyl cis-trans isomerase n=1 Tax=Natronospirillum sp. TaxID=2812955 RepID=UPI0025F48514|nr:peptidylprolyl isomerase [Natronospirillum sp.]MCH8551797.1 peptidylprolyl isomerase [Natronospirillum sp.]